jgi:hypothetical protein
MGRESSKHGRGGKYVKRFGEKITREHTSRKRVLNRRIILKLILNKLLICGLDSFVLG